MANKHGDYWNGNDDRVREDCSPDEMIAEFFDILLPEDYEEGKENIKTDFTSINEVLESMKRFNEYRLNVSQKMSEFTKRMNSRLSEALMTTELPTDCMTSLVRIMSAAKNGELWAIKCKFHATFLNFTVKINYFLLVLSIFTCLINQLFQFLMHNLGPTMVCLNLQSLHLVIMICV